MNIKKIPFIMMLSVFIASAVFTAVSAAEIGIQKWCESFDGFVVGEISENGIGIQRGGGDDNQNLDDYQEVITTDKGSSFKFGVNATSATPVNKGSRTNVFMFVNAGITTKAQYDFDFMLTGYADTNAYFMIGLKDSTGNSKPEKLIKITDKVYVDSVSKEYTPNQWHHIKIIIDLTSDECNLYFDNEADAFATISVDDMDKLDYLRVYSRRDANKTISQATGMIIDNISFTEFEEISGPEISMSYEVGSEHTIPYSVFMPVDVYVSDAADVEQVNVYVNDELAVEAAEAGTYTVNLNDYEYSENGFTIKATATNSYGISSEALTQIKFNNYVCGNYWIEDFDTFTEGDNGITLYNKEFGGEGYIKTDNNALVMGIDKENGTNDGTRANMYALLDTKHITSEAVYEFDVNINGKGNSDFYYMIGFKDTTTGDEIQSVSFKDKLTIGNSSMEYSENYKAHIKLDISAANGVCNVYANNSFMGSIDISKLTAIDTIRIYARRNAGVSDSKYNSGSICIDNIAKTYTREVLTITEAGNENVVDYTATSFAVKLSEEIKSGTVNADNIVLSQNGNNVAIKSVSYDNGVLTVNTKKKLKANKTYTITLKNSICFADGVSIVKPSIGEFTTTAGTLSIGAPVMTGTGDVRFVTSGITNVSGVQTNVVAVVTIFEESGKFVSSYCKSETVDSFLNLTVEIPKLQNGQYAEFYVWDSLSDMNMLSDEINILR